MRENYGYFLIIVASTIWGTMGILGKLAFEYKITPSTLIALRLLISSPTLIIPIALFKRELFKIQKRDLPSFLVLGVIGIAFLRITYFYSVDLTTATISAVLFYTHPVFITLYSSVFLKEKITSWTIIAIALTFSGVGLTVKAYESALLSANVLGVIFGLLSSLSFVIYFFTVKNLRNRYTNWTLSLYGDGIGALALVPVAIFSLPEMVAYPQRLWLIILTIAWFPSLLAYLIYSYALKHVEPSKGSVLTVMEPVSAAVYSAAILGETFEPLQAVGIMLALTGVILLFYKPKSEK
jgi:drug/metabolite transporter (DMT)-like permease